jgi:hypothetical protein
MAAYFASHIGASDSMLSLKWQELRKLGVTLVSVERPLVVVLHSFAQAGFPTRGMWPLLVRLQEALDTLPPDVPRYHYADLSPAAVSAIFERCMDRPCPPVWLDEWWNRRVVTAYGPHLFEGVDLPGVRAFYGVG